MEKCFELHQSLSPDATENDSQAPYKMDQISDQNNARELQLPKCKDQNNLVIHSQASQNTGQSDRSSKPPQLTYQNEIVMNSQLSQQNTDQYNKLPHLPQNTDQCDKHPQSPQNTDQCDKLPQSPQNTYQCEKHPELHKNRDQCDKHSQSPQNTDSCYNHPRSPQNTDSCDNHPQSPQNTDSCDKDLQSLQSIDKNEIMSERNKQTQLIHNVDQNVVKSHSRLPQDMDQEKLYIHEQISKNLSQSDTNMKPTLSAHACIQDEDSYLKPSESINVSGLGGHLNQSQNTVQNEIEDQQLNKKGHSSENTTKTSEVKKVLVEKVIEEESCHPSARREVRNYSYNESDTDDDEEDMIMIDFNHDSDCEENMEYIELNNNQMNFDQVNSEHSSLESVKQNDGEYEEQEIHKEIISNGPAFQNTEAETILNEPQLQNIQKEAISNEPQFPNIQEEIILNEPQVQKIKETISNETQFQNIGETISNEPQFENIKENTIEPQFQQSDADCTLLDISSAKNDSNENNQVIIKILQEKVTTETERKWFEGITNANKTATTKTAANKTTINKTTTELSYHETVDKKNVLCNSVKSILVAEASGEKFDNVGSQTTYPSDATSQHSAVGSIERSVSKPSHVYDHGQSVNEEEYINVNLQEAAIGHNGQKCIVEVREDFSGGRRIDIGVSRDVSSHDQERSDNTCDTIICLSSDDEENPKKNFAETELFEDRPYPKQNISNNSCTINEESENDQNCLKVKSTTDSLAFVSKCTSDKAENSQQHSPSSLSELAVCSTPETNHHPPVSTTCTNNTNNSLPVYSLSDKSQNKIINQALAENPNENKKQRLPLDGTIILLSDDDDENNDEMHQKSDQKKKTDGPSVSQVKRAGEKRPCEIDVSVHQENKRRRVMKASSESFSNSECHSSPESVTTQTSKSENLAVNNCNTEINKVTNASKPSTAEESKKRTNQKPGCVCYLCFADFLVRDELLSHIRDVHSYYKNAPKFCCTHCGSCFQSLTKVSAHEYTVHGLTYSCQFCGKLQQSEESLRQHVINHLRPVVYVCQSCKSDFQTALNVKKHIEEKHNEGTDWSHYLKCQLCKCLFNSQDKLYSHFINLHSQVLKHHCRACSQNFFTDDALLVHRSSSNYILNGQRVKEYTNFETDFKKLIKSTNLSSCSIPKNRKIGQSSHELKKRKNEQELKKTGNDEISHKNSDTCVIDLTETIDISKDQSNFVNASQAVDPRRNIKEASERCSTPKQEDNPHLENDIAPALKKRKQAKDVAQQTLCIPNEQPTTNKDNIIAKSVEYGEIFSDICMNSSPENTRYDHSVSKFQDLNICVDKSNNSQSQTLTLSNQIVNSGPEIVKTDKQCNSAGVMSVCANNFSTAKGTNILRDLSQNEQDCQTSTIFKGKTGCSERIANNMSASYVESSTSHINEELFKYFAEKMKDNENEKVGVMKASKHDDRILDQLLDIQERSQQTVKLVSECLKEGKIQIEKPEKTFSNQSPDDRIGKVVEQRSSRLHCSDSTATESEVYFKTKNQILTLISNHLSNAPSKLAINDKVSEELMSNSSFVLALYNSLKKSQNKK